LTGTTAGLTKRSSGFTVSIATGARSFIGSYDRAIRCGLVVMLALLPITSV